MTNKELASGLFRQATSRYKTMEEAFQIDDYPYVIRTAQECVELCLKAVLISIGIDPPKWHDVGSILLDNASRFPSLSQNLIEEMAFISRNLRGEREKSMYGDDILRLPPDRLYSKYDAEMAKKWAEKVYITCLPFFTDRLS
ncbi:MAG: HEPN domain-containing protein [Thermodesulfobacteriota bacterium]|nr:HEPN domain-containing protein [Thermodesulfobacteriota bacterium]